MTRAIEDTGRGMLLAMGSPHKRLLPAAAAGLQVCTHAIGDAAISTDAGYLSSIEDAVATSADRRIDVQRIWPRTISSVWRSCTSSSRCSRTRQSTMGAGRKSRNRTRPCEQNVCVETFSIMAYGWPSAPIGRSHPVDPLLTLYAAVTCHAGRQVSPEGWFPEQKLTIERRTPADRRLSRCRSPGTRQGSIEPGKLADLVLLDVDVLSIPPAQLRNVHVVKNWLGGERMIVLQ